MKALSKLILIFFLTISCLPVLRYDDKGVGESGGNA